MKRNRGNAILLGLAICLAVFMPSALALAEQQGQLEIAYQFNGSAGYFTLSMADSDKRILYDTTSTVALHLNGDNVFLNYAASDGVYGECLKYSDESIDVVFDITSVGNPITGNSGASADLAEFTLYLTNKSAVPVTAGALMFFDTTIGTNDAAPLYIPGVGKSINETTYTGGNVPASIYAYEVDNPASPGLVATFLANYNNNVVPDRLTLGNYGQLMAAPYDYNGSGVQIGDSSILAQWSDRSLAAGQSVEWTMYLGRGAAQAAQSGSLTLSANGDAQIGEGNAFQVLQTVRNITEDTIANVKATITLPSGWSFASGNGTVTKDTLARHEDWVTTWNLIAPAGATSAAFPMTAQVGEDAESLVTLDYSANNIGVPGGSTPSPTPDPSTTPNPTPDPSTTPNPTPDQGGMPFYSTFVATEIPKVLSTGEVSLSGGVYYASSTIMRRGFVYASTNGDLNYGAVGVSFLEGAQNGTTFTGTLSGLKAGTYYLRAYATDGTQAWYGEQRTITVTQSSTVVVPNSGNGADLLPFIFLAAGSLLLALAAIRTRRQGE